MFLAFPELSLPHRLLANTFGGTPHPREKAGTIASQFWPFLTFFAPRLCQKSRQPVKRKATKMP
jgi:hypothetical protein